MRDKVEQIRKSQGTKQIKDFWIWSNKPYEMNIGSWFRILRKLYCKIKLISILERNEPTSKIYFQVFAVIFLINKK